MSTKWNAVKFWTGGRPQCRASSLCHNCWSRAQFMGECGGGPWPSSTAKAWVPRCNFVLTNSSAFFTCLAGQHRRGFDLMPGYLFWRLKTRHIFISCIMHMPVLFHIVSHLHHRVNWQQVFRRRPWGRFHLNGSRYVCLLWFQNFLGSCRQCRRHLCLHLN